MHRGRDRPRLDVQCRTSSFRPLRVLVTKSMQWSSVTQLPAGRCDSLLSFCMCHAIEEQFSRFRFELTQPRFSIQVSMVLIARPWGRLRPQAISIWISLYFLPELALSFTPLQISCPSSNPSTRSPPLQHNLISRMCFSGSTITLVGRFLHSWRTLAVARLDDIRTPRMLMMS